MGGTGSGRPPGARNKNKQPDLDPSEIINEAGETVFKDPPPDDKPKAKGKAKAANVNQQEARQKINLLFGALARLTGRDYTYQDDDFNSEAAGLSRLAQKFPIVGYAITLMDPLFIIAGLVQKFFKLPVKQKKAQAEQPKQGQGQVVNLR
jgi:hypothetical protein